MDERGHNAHDVAEQAIHDRSVIDHVVHTFSSGDAEAPARAPTSVNSAAIYHRIRRTWADQR